MKKRVDIMMDIETLGKSDNATLFQISAIAFDITTGKQINMVPEFNAIADIEKNETLNVDGSTLKWWLKTDKELFAKLLNNGSKSSKEIVTDFHDWLKGIIDSFGDKNCYLWGNGILFDNRIIKKQFENIGLEYPIFYRNDRDVRTILELASLKSGISENKIKEMVNDASLVLHNAIDDVKKQIRLVTFCYYLIMDMDTEVLLKEWNEGNESIVI